MKHTKSVAFTTESTRKCRCCTFPSTKFLELDSISRACGTDRTYKDILYEIANIKVSDAQEKFLIQKVCQKCSTQLNNCYKFIIQARKAYEQHLSAINDLSTENDNKDFGNIPELLKEVPIDLISEKKSRLQRKDSAAIAANSGSLMEIEIKTEPILLECTPDTDVLMHEDKLQVNEIKEEQSELVEQNIEAKPNEKDKSLVFTKVQEQKDLTYDPIYQEEIEHFDNFNTDSENDDEDSEKSMTEDDFDKDLSKAPIAISCDICHKIYRDKKALRTHKHYTHMPDDKKRPCPLCSFKSSRLSNLKVHIGVVHGADKVKEIFKPSDINGQFSCSVCNQSFSRKDTLQRHIKTIHENPQRKEPQKPKAPKEQERFLCTYCGGVFRSKCGLVRHVVIHTGERPFPCEICQKTFKRPEDLHMHRIIHSDKKPHQCLQCGKAFKRSDKLKVHMRVHSELRPYKCNECEKTFKYPNVLSTHMLIHTGQNPFQCKTCGESFSLRSSFNNHCLVNGHL